MRVYITPPRVESRSISRIATELQRHAPASIEFVRDRDAADLVVLHVIGRRDQMLRAAERCRARGQAYVVNQYCLRSTQRPHTSDWTSLWADARCVWSYYDLPRWVRDDDGSFTFSNFYHSPLGADASVFLARKPTPPPFVVGMTGYTPGVECLREVVDAAREVGGRVFHLGAGIPYGADITTAVTNLSDHELASYYAQCKYVSALRRVEGFELPAAEALLSGTRPIMFDRSHYRQWFAPFARFIPEQSDRQSVTAYLQDILRSDPMPITTEERVMIAERFNWRTISAAYWKRCA
jgi:hypothetical protein